MRLCLSKYTLILTLGNGLWIFRNGRFGIMSIAFIKAVYSLVFFSRWIPWLIYNTTAGTITAVLWCVLIVPIHVTLSKKWILWKETLSSWTIYLNCRRPACFRAHTIIGARPLGGRGPGAPPPGSASAKLIECVSIWIERIFTFLHGSTSKYRTKQKRSLEAVGLSSYKHNYILQIGTRSRIKKYNVCFN